MGWAFLWVGLGSAGAGLRSQVSSGKEGLSRWRAGGRFDRFQCSLRPDPAAAW